MLYKYMIWYEMCKMVTVMKNSHQKPYTVAHIFSLVVRATIILAKS